MFHPQTSVLSILGLFDRHLSQWGKKCSVSCISCWRTQSKKSTPSMTASIISSGGHYPIKYRGAFSGKRGVCPSQDIQHCWFRFPYTQAHRWISLESLFPAKFEHSPPLESRYIPPWTIAKRAGSLSRFTCRHLLPNDLFAPLRPSHIQKEKVGDTFI